MKIENSELNRVLRIEKWQMITGVLRRYEEFEGIIEFVFPFGKIVIPTKFLTTNHTNLVGKKVSILRTDIPDNEYIVHID